MFSRLPSSCPFPAKSATMRIVMRFWRENPHPLAFSPFFSPPIEIYLYFFSRKMKKIVLNGWQSKKHRAISGSFWMPQRHFRVSTFRAAVENRVGTRGSRRRKPKRRRRGRRETRSRENGRLPARMNEGGLNRRRAREGEKEREREGRR